MRLFIRTYLYFLLVLAVGFTACNSEKSDFQKAVRQHSTEGYQHFIRDHPESVLKEEATFRLARLSAKPAAYLLFLYHYPKSSFAQAAFRSIDSLGMVFVEGGHFQMGCDTCLIDEEGPRHDVEIRNFYMDKTEVTYAQFSKFIEATRYKTDAEREGTSSILVDGKWEKREGVNWRFDVMGNKRPLTDDNLPVAHVSWYDAREYAKWIGKRLPTEAEWEFAARGGKLSRNYKYSGSNDFNEVAWCQENSGNQCHPVATKKPNELGLYDMSGNVTEWCSDWYETDYYKHTLRNNPTGPQGGSIVVLRGGGWNDEPSELRITARFNSYPLYWYGGIGFRCVADMPIDVKTGFVPN
jgi:formylglycine-generating enzyme required for sulfatase activity